MSLCSALRGEYALSVSMSRRELALREVSGVLDRWEAALVRALATLACIGDQAGPGRSPTALLESRPAELDVAEDGMGFGPGGKTLQIQLRWAGRGETWSIPLPPALYAEP